VFLTTEASESPTQELDFGIHPQQRAVGEDPQQNPQTISSHSNHCPDQEIDE
jgi:hypothetical protein